MPDGGLEYWQTVGQWEQLERDNEMGRYASNSGEHFEQAPTGNHIARCIRLIDIGTQRGEYQGKPTVRNQVLVTWELCNEMMEDGKPFSVSRFYTNSLNEKANLRADLESWRGRAFSPEELVKFDLQSILGKPCMLNVVRSEKDKAVVASIAAMPKGTTAPECVNRPFAFWLDEWSDEVFDGLPDGIKRLIAASDEYKARGTAPKTASKPSAVAEEEDIPFANPYRGRTSLLV